MSAVAAPGSTVEKESAPAAEAAGLLVTPPKRAADPRLPAWFTERSAAGWEDFLRAPLPGPRNENWRYSSAARIALAKLQPAAKATAADEQAAIAESTGIPDTAAKLVFVNEELVHADTKGLPAGAVCLPFAQALADHEELVKRNFMKREAFLGSAKFSALHLAHLRQGAVIIVPKNVVIEKPIEVFHWVSGDGMAIFPHTLVIAQDHAGVTVVDHYRTLGGGLGFSCSVSDLVAESGSKITYVSCQEMNARSQALSLSSTATHRDSHVKSFQLQLGAEFSRSENVSDLVGEGSRSDMLSVSLPIGTQTVDQRTLQRHVAPHAYSDLLYKNALYDQSRSIFTGLIHVFEGAHYTDAYQTCRNLINSEEAEATSLPGLEINADQVKCSHGATSGPVSEEELFYLKARGISDPEARQLIVLGFIQDAISRIGNSEVEEMVGARIREKFAARAA